MLTALAATGKLAEGIGLACMQLQRRSGNQERGQRGLCSEHRALEESARCMSSRGVFRPNEDSNCLAAGKCAHPLWKCADAGVHAFTSDSSILNDQSAMSCLLVALAVLFACPLAVQDVCSHRAAALVSW